MSKPTATDADRVAAAIVPTDAVARAAELRWGVARLESLVSAETLLSWKKGFTLYSDAIARCDPDEVKRLAPMIAQAILAMEEEAEERGHQPMSPTCWEAPMAGGRVLVVTRTFAEASALQASSDGRERVVWTMEELANVMPRLEEINAIKNVFPGARVQSSVKKTEGFAHDVATETDFEFLHQEMMNGETAL